MGETEDLVSELDRLTLEEPEETLAPVAKPKRKEPVPSVPAVAAPVSIPEVPVAAISQVKSAPKTIDEFIEQMAETKKQEFIEGAYKKMFAALTDAPTPQPQPVYYEPQLPPVSSKVAAPVPVSKKTFSTKAMLFGTALALISGVAIIIILSYLL